MLIQTISYDLNLNVPLEFGQNKVLVEAIDAAGNITKYESKIYRLQEGEVRLFDIVEYSLTSNGPVSSDRPLTIEATSNDIVDWSVDIINPDGVVEATLTQYGSQFSGVWSPEETKKLNGEYTVKINAIKLDQVITVTDSFYVYNYPIAITNVEVVKQPGYVAVDATIQNLGPHAENPMVIVQVTDDKGYVVNISTVKMNNLLNGQVVSLGSGFGLTNAGQYNVEVYVWTGWNNTETLSSPYTTTFTIQ